MKRSVAKKAILVMMGLEAADDKMTMKKWSRHTTRLMKKMTGFKVRFTLKVKMIDQKQSMILMSTIDAFGVSLMGNM